MQSFAFMSVVIAVESCKDLSSFIQVSQLEKGFYPTQESPCKYKRIQIQFAINCAASIYLMYLSLYILPERHLLSAEFRSHRMSTKRNKRTTVYIEIIMVHIESLKC